MGLRSSGRFDSPSATRSGATIALLKRAIEIIDEINGSLSGFAQQEIKVTYYEVIDISGSTVGSLSDTPTGATIQEDEFGISGSSILSTLLPGGKPSYESPKDGTGNFITANLATNGSYTASNTFPDPVALIYSFTITQADYINGVDAELTIDLGTQNVPADQLPYDNTTSGLTAVDVQSAIDEIDNILDGITAGTGVDTFAYHAGRSQASTTNIWLRRSQNIPLNLSPYIVPFNATIIAISASGNASQTWDAEVYKNADVRAGGVPLDANKIAEQLIIGANQAFSLISVNVDAGDEIGIYMRGTAINRPSVSLYLRRRT